MKAKKLPIGVLTYSAQTGEPDVWTVVDSVEEAEELEAIAGGVYFAPFDDGGDRFALGASNRAFHRACAFVRARFAADRAECAEIHAATA